jgi:anti-anti-sigma factor
MEINTRRAGNATIVSLAGELDAYWAGETERELLGLVDKGRHELVLDLSELSYLSSGGLRALLRTHRRLTELGGKLGLAAPQAYVRDVLSVSGLAQMLSVYDTLQAALDALHVVETGGAEDWADVLRYVSAHGAYRFRACTGGRSALQVVGNPTDHLWSRATPEGLTSRNLAELGYGLAIGAAAESAAAAIDRLGEMLVLPGSIFWLPGDGRLVPDFLAADLGGARLSVHLLNGFWMQGEPQFYCRFTAEDPEIGASLEDWAHGLLDWAAHQASEAPPAGIGVALRADLAEMWGVGLKRAPRAGRAPANGQEISHRENIADWLHFSTEPEFPNCTLLAAGVLALNAFQFVGGQAWAAVFGDPVRSARLPFRAHLHGAAFRPVPELGGTKLLHEEIQHVITQAELVGVAHLLPNTRLRSVLFGAWLL